MFKFLDDGVTNAGLTREGLFYCGLVFRQVGLALRALYNKGEFNYLDRNNKYYKKLSKIPNWYYALLFTGGKYFQNINDSHYHPDYPLFGFLLTFGDLRPKLVSHIWELCLGESGLGTFGQDISFSRSSLFEAMICHPGAIGNTFLPKDIPMLFCKQQGYTVSKTVGTGNQAVLTFNSGPYIGVVHDQSDNNHFTFSYKGVPLVIDAGYSNIPKEGSPSSSYGHSSVVINGRGQLPSGKGKGCSGKIIFTKFNETHTIIVGDSTSSYCESDYNSVLWAYRHCVFVKQPFPYLLIFDDVCKKLNKKSEFTFVYNSLFSNRLEIKEKTVCGIFDFEGRQVGLKHHILFPEESVSIKHEIKETQNCIPVDKRIVWYFSCSKINPHFINMFIPFQYGSLPECAFNVRKGERDIDVFLDWKTLPMQDIVSFPLIDLKNNKKAIYANFSRKIKL
ncbi:MAG: heparinase II/III family protein [Cyclobacteriaceae bacterium]